MLGEAGSLDDDVLAELAELAEQLVTADEELRAQHEELEAARQALLRSQASYEQVLRETATAYLLTDQYGIVRQLNPAAEALLGQQSSSQRACRPLAARFTAPDRRRIRTALSQLKLSDGRPVSCRANLQRPDGSVIEVDVTATLLGAAESDRATLSWQLLPVEGVPQRGPRGVPPSPQQPEDLAELATELSELAAILATQQSAQQVLDQAVLAARQAVPGAAATSVSLVHPNGALDTPSSTGALATACDRAQHELGEGPSLQPLSPGQVLQIDDLSTESRWPGWSARARALGAGSLLVCQLATPRQVRGALNLYSTEPAAFDQTSAVRLPVLAAHVGIALARVHNEANLHQAIQSRQLIGQAVGILMERHRLGAPAAFDLLVAASQASQLKLREIALRVSETGLEPADAAGRN